MSFKNIVEQITSLFSTISHSKINEEDPNVDVRRTVALGDDAENVVEASSSIDDEPEDLTSLQSDASTTFTASYSSVSETDDEPETDDECGIRSVAEDNHAYSEGLRRSPEDRSAYELCSEAERDDAENVVEASEYIDLYFFYALQKIFDSKTEDFLCDNPTPRFKSYLDHTKNFDDDGIIYYQNPSNNIYEIDEEYTKMYQVKSNSFVIKMCCRFR